jgi:hypothetical protein
MPILTQSVSLSPVAHLWVAFHLRRCKTHDRRPQKRTGDDSQPASVVLCRETHNRQESKHDK